MKKTIYQVGDTVYHYKHGKGKIVEIDESLNFPIRALFNKEFFIFTLDGTEDHFDTIPTLSFAPYDLINGGFSNKRPLKPGTLIYIKGDFGWYVRVFSHFDHKGKLYYFENGNFEGCTRPCESQWSLKNPMEK